MNESLSALLRTVPIFATLDEDALQTLVRHCRVRSYRAEQVLFHTRDSGHTLYVLLSGSVRIQKTTPQGEVLHLAERGAGDFFGELSLFDGSLRMADAVTNRPCEVLQLDREAFLRCMLEKPQVALGVLTALAARLREAADRLEQQQSRDVSGRVSGLLLELMASDSLPELDGGFRITRRISQQEMAERLGTTRESVNRTLAALRTNGAIRQEGRVLIVLKPDLLRKYAGQ